MSTFKLSNNYLSQDVYRTCVSDDHFLVQTERVIAWGVVSEPFAALAKNAHGGRPRWSPVSMVKMLFLAFLYDRSDREIEEIATNYLPVKRFLRLAVDERAPDHNTLSRFRDEAILRLGEQAFADLFDTIIRDLRRAGLVFGAVYAIDATHTVANVDTDKHQDPKTPRDPNASWGCKGHETRITTEGEKVQIPKYFYGYKAHLISDARGFIAGVHGTPGNAADLDGGDDLVHKVMTEDERRGVRVLTADKGYGCPVWINLLEKHTGVMTAFSLPKPMIGRGEHRKKWRAYLDDPGRSAFRRTRSVIERVNADLKDNHGLRRCRYLGLAKYKLQLTMASIAHNVKIAVQQITGAVFRPI